MKNEEFATALFPPPRGGVRGGLSRGGVRGGLGIALSKCSPPRGGVRGGLLLFLLLLASCATKRQGASTSAVATGGTETTVTALQNIVETVNANRQDETFATAKMNLTITSADKSLSIGGNLRMKRDDVIQLSLVTFGILEVARIEITPDYFLAIDKLGRQYVKAPYADVSFLKSAGIDFYTLQSLFWDELFVLGAGKSAPGEKQFKKTIDGDRATLTNADSRLAVLSFSVNVASGLLRQTTVSPHSASSSPYLTWKYDDFSSLGKKSFPTSHTLTIRSSKPISASLSLSNLRNDSGWETRTEVSSRYKEVSVEELLTLLLKGKN